MSLNSNKPVFIKRVKLTEFKTVKGQSWEEGSREAKQNDPWYYERAKKRLNFNLKKK